MIVNLAAPYPYKPLCLNARCSNYRIDIIKKLKKDMYDRFVSQHQHTDPPRY